MPGEAYRDALATADARISQLETEARERGLSVEASRRRFGYRRVAALTFACIALALGIVAVRIPLPAGVVYVDRSFGSPPTLPPKATWFEPATASTYRGPIEVFASDNRRLLVGLLWERTRENGGLRVAAFDRETLRPRWVSNPVPADWVSADTDWRFNLSMSEQIIVLEDITGHEYGFDVDSGQPRGSRTIPPKPHPVERIPMSDSLTGMTGYGVISCERNQDGFRLWREGTWLVQVPGAGRASRLRFLRVDGDDVFVLIDDALHVFDVKTGSHRGLLEAP